MRLQTPPVCLRRCLLPLLTLATACTVSTAAQIPNRLQANAQAGANTPLTQNVSTRVRRATMLRHLQGDTPLQTMTLVLSRTAAQESDLDTLIAAQQSPASPQYHQWLTPEQFGARFGVSDSDRTVLKNWLQAQGFTVLDDAPSRNLIRFSGTAAAAESAFSTTLNTYQLNGQQFFENSTAPQMPAALSQVVAGVMGLSSYRLPAASAKPRFVPEANTILLHPEQTTTSSSGTHHFLVPWDIRQIYNANTLTNAGTNGTGITIGVIGQSAVDTAQIGFFQTLTGQTQKAPTLVLVPNTGSSAPVSGDEGESEADLEYALGVAPGAGVSFIYTGNSSNSGGVFGALSYAITSKSALFGNNPNIITLSYGGCEPADAVATTNSPSVLTSIEPILRQASAQGQTIVVASGDTGAAGCDDSPPALLGLQVSYPASSPNVTGVGGTEFMDTTNASTYWSATNNSQQGSALGYIPEMVWNDTQNAQNTSHALSAGGGGASRLFSKPNWQTGTGVPSDGVRDVPDISFSASNIEDPYILCTSDTSYTSTSNGVTSTGKCTATSYGSFIVGGTSLSTPSFAGLLSIAMQYAGSQGLGNINPILYGIASSTAGSSVFHDVTTGNNQVPCTTGFEDCTGSSLGYSAGTGYDLATGLGSMDISAFANVLKTAGSQTSQTNATSVTIAELSASSTAVNFRINVAAANNTATPTGTVSVAIDGGTATSYTLGSGASGGTPTAGQVAFSVGSPLTTAGAHTIVANYSGDGSFAASTSTLKITTLAANAGFTLASSATSMTATATTPAKLSLTLTSTNGFFGLVNYTFALASGSATPPGCLSIDSGTVGLQANAAAVNTLTYSEAACASASIVKSPSGAVLAKQQPQPRPGSSMPLTAMAAALAGGLLCMFRKGRATWAGRLAAFACLAMFLGIAGCGGSSNSTPATTTTTTTSRTYGIVVTATSNAYPYAAVTQTVNVSIVAQ